MGAFMLWGMAQGPLRQASVLVATAAPTQLLDSSNAARTPDSRLKTITVTATGARDIFIGTDTVSTTAFLHVARAGGDPVVFDIREAGADNFWAIAATADSTASVGQAG